MDDLYQFVSQPGVMRDSTQLESSFYSDGLWVRWQRGKPRKMGGYRAMSQLINGPVRSMLVDSRNGNNSVHYFGEWGIQRQQFSATGAGGGLEDRLPGFVRNKRLTWSHAIMSSSSGGSYSALLAAGTPDVDQIDSDERGNVWAGNMADGSPMTVVTADPGGTPLMISGGVTVLQPFAVVYGSNGLIKNSQPNDFSPLGWDYTQTGTFANEANVAGTKFIYGAPVRGGSQAPAGLFWAIDALVRMSFVGGTNIWQFDTLSQPTSVLSKKGIVEHDGKFYWPGTDRFLFYNGVVQELPNQMNSNWFFENLNYANRNKVWGTKIPRFGEIWWFYPRGDSTECDNAVIFNYIENTWYDAIKRRSAGGQVQLFPFPIWAGDEDSHHTIALPVSYNLLTSANTPSGAVLPFASTTGVAAGQVAVVNVLVPPGTTVVSTTPTSVTLSAAITAPVPINTLAVFSTMTTPFKVGEIVTGTPSGAVGTVERSIATALNLINVTGTFLAGDALRGSLGGVAQVVAAPFDQQVVTAYQHEFGYDKIIDQETEAIHSYFTSKQFGFAVGNPLEDAPKTVNMMTRLTRFELDFNQVGPLTISLFGRSFGQGTDRLLEAHTLEKTDLFVDFKKQERILSLRVESNVVGGYFKQGHVMFALGPGDERSSKDTA